MRHVIFIAATACLFTLATAAHAGSAYDDVEGQYMSLIKWSQEQIETSRRYVNEDNMAYACSYIKGARDGFIEAEKAARDLVRMDTNAGRDTTSAEESLQFTLDMQENLNGVIPEVCD